MRTILPACQKKKAILYLEDFKRAIINLPISKLLFSITILFLFSVANAQSPHQEFTSTGTFTVPAGVTKITVIVRGAGGGGGSNSLMSDGAGGGGGGGFAKAVDYAVTPGQQYICQVGIQGNGGTFGNGGTSGNGGTGGQSFFGSASLLYANGGTGGTGKVSGSNSPGGGGNGGAAGGSIAGSFYTGGKGGDGANAQDAGGGGGGSSAGSSNNGNDGITPFGTTSTIGGNGGIAPSGGYAGGKGGTHSADPNSTSVNGAIGSSYGGGGGGGADRTSATSGNPGTPAGPNTVGGAGGSGYIYIEWTCPTNPTVSYTPGTYCKSLTLSDQPSFSPAGGTFSANSASLSINTSSGVINPSASTAGSYVVYYTLPAVSQCSPVQGSTNIKINSLPNAPVAINATACYDGTAHMGDAAVASSDEMVYWYTTATSNVMTAAPSQTDPGMSQAYAEAQVISTGCRSATRTLVTAIINAKPSISVNPVDMSIIYGNSATFSVNASAGSGNISYRWQVSIDGVNFNDISGADQSSYTITKPAVSLSNNKYRVQILNSNGCGPVTSEAATLIVGKRTITITADAKTKTYGDADPALTATVPMGNVIGTDAPSGSLTRVSGENVSTYAIQKGTYTYGDNYDETYVPANLTITQRSVTVKAVMSTKTYDGTTTSTGSPTIGILATGDAVNTPPVQVYDNKNAGNSKMLTPSGLTIKHNSDGSDATGNYNIIYTQGMTGVIEQRAITLTADAQTKVYGANDPPLSAQVTSGTVINSDIVSGNLTRVVGEAVGSYQINQGTYTYGSNYNETYVPANLTITHKDATITANNQMKCSGNTFSFTGMEFTYSGFISPDMPASVTLTSNGAPATATAGTYDIAPSNAQGTGLSNYNITYVNGTFTVNSTPSVNQPSNVAVCKGDMTSEIVFTSDVSGTTYSWTNDNQSIGLAASGTGNIPAFIVMNSTDVPVVANIVVSPATTYCTGSSKTFTITVNPTPTVITTLDNATYCNNTAVLQKSLDGTPAGIVFDIAGGASIGLANQTGVSAIPAYTAMYPSSGNGSGPVTVAIAITPRANGCIGTPKIYNVTVNPTPSVVLDPVTQTVCNGSAITTITFNGTVNGTSYNWTNNNTSIGLAASGIGNSIPSFTVTNTSGTLQTATIMVSTTANGCTGATQMATISVRPQPAFTTSQTNVNCYDGTNGSITVTAGVGTSPFQISKDGGINYTAAVTSPYTFNTLSAGTYNIKIKDANDCVSALAGMDVTITQPDKLSAMVSHTNVSCNSGNNGTITISSPTGGSGSYEYSIGNSTYQQSGSFSGLTANTYQVFIRDVIVPGCVIDLDGTAGTEITQPGPLVASVISHSDVTCFGGNNGSLAVTATGGTAPFRFSNDDGNTYTTATTSPYTFNGLSQGGYSIRVKDANDCISAAVSQTINEPMKLNATITATNVTCNGANNGTITITNATGGNNSNYKYSIDGSNYVTTNSFAGLIPDAYQVFIQDGSDATCIIDLDGSAGTIITQPAALSATASGTNVSCYGSSNGSATVSVTGGTTPYTYSWNTNPVQITQSISGLSAGTYTITVTDNKGCQSIKSYQVTQPDALSATADGTNVSCYSGSSGTATVSVTGGTVPYSYNWSGPNNFTSTMQNISSLTAGIYTVMVMDSKGCQTTSSYEVIQPVALTATASGTSVSCYSSNNGTATVNVTGGTTPYAYSWSGPNNFTSTMQNISNLVAGTYMVTVTDNKGCQIIISYQVMQPDILSATVNATNVTCNGANNGTITISGAAGGNNSNYKYSIVGSNYVTTNSFTNLMPGTYQVSIQDGSDAACIIDLDGMNGTAITQPDLLVVSVLSRSDVTCFGGNNGSITVAATGGTASFRFSKDGGITYVPSTTGSYTFSGLQQGTYSIRVKDANDCISAAFSQTVSEPQAITASGVVTNLTCNGNNTGAINLTITGGSGSYMYSWIGPSGFTSNMEDIINLTAGTYTVVVTESNGCAVNNTTDNKVSFTISQPDALMITSISKTDVVCNSSGSATANVMGGTGTYTYSWTGPNSFTSTMQSISSLIAGIYNVTITDANMCSTSGSVTINFLPVTNVTMSTSYATLAAAIAAASTGDDLKICNGTYTAGVVVDKPLTIEGAGPGGTNGTKLVANTGNNNLITIQANSVIIKNLQVEGMNGGSSTHGIYINSAVTGTTIDNVLGSLHEVGVMVDDAAVVDGLTVKSSTFSANGSGIGIKPGGKAKNVSITGNTISGNDYGITSNANTSVTTNGTDVTDVIITGNTISNNSIKGVYFEKLAMSSINNNTFTGNGTAATGNGLELNLKYGTYSNINISGNILTSNGFNTATNGAAVIVKALTSAGSGTVLNGVTIQNNEITSAPNGISIGNNVTRSTVVVDHNKITNCTQGFVSYSAPAGSTTTLSFNGITNPGSTYATIANGDVNSSITATCNWFGTTDNAIIKDHLGGAGKDNITYIPHLSSGDNATGTTGFQTNEVCSTCALSFGQTVITDVTCNGASNGNIDITVENGSSSYTYAWTKMNSNYISSTQDLSNVSAGTYMVNVTDNNSGCSAAKSSITVTEPPVVNGTISGTTTVAQNSSTSSKIIFRGTGGVTPHQYTFTYAINGGTLQTITTTSGVDTAFVLQTNATAGQYTYVLQSISASPGCTGIVATNNQVTVTVNPFNADLTPAIRLAANQFTMGSGKNTVIQLQELLNSNTAASMVEFSITVPTGFAISYNPSTTNMTPAGSVTNYALNNSGFTVTAMQLGNRRLVLHANVGVSISASQAANLGFVITRTAGTNGSTQQMIVSVTNDTNGTYDTNSGNNIISRGLINQ